MARNIEDIRKLFPYSDNCLEMQKTIDKIMNEKSKKQKSQSRKKKSQSRKKKSQSRKKSHKKSAKRKSLILRKFSQI